MSDDQKIDQPVTMCKSRQCNVTKQHDFCILRWDLVVSVDSGCLAKTLGMPSPPRELHCFVVK